MRNVSTYKTKYSKLKNDYARHPINAQVMADLLWWKRRKMNNALRNTIILSVLAILLITGFWSFQRKLSKNTQRYKPRMPRLIPSSSPWKSRLPKDSLLLAYEVHLLCKANKAKSW